MWQSLPELGTGVLYAILVAAAYTLGVSLVAGGTGRPRFLAAARLGAYATISLVALAIGVLAYAFVTHDFRIRYVAHYSDRSMPTTFLLTALWGGQDGSLLWWLFLLSCYTGACVAWMRGKYRVLQPYVIATLTSIIMFFAVLMLFAANPFWVNAGGARLDGEGLNPLLQNFYMIIHPPSLYTGFVGCAVPFAFAVAALATGRLDNEWLAATRKWMLFAWLFLSIGNALGMLWAYEELGWGGYWAWDPVENAACLPWFTATAYLHSAMTQERRGMLKVWNVSLILGTFLLTIFGTFLTRSGMIASVHSFAQSDIGKYFVYYMGFLLAASLGLVVWRLPLLRSEGRLESSASREAAFVINNWALLGIMVFIAVATVFPKVSELWNETVTVGPAFYNRWIVPAGLFVFALMGAGPLFGWRKTSQSAMVRGFVVPTAVMVVTAGLHLALGRRLGFPAIVQNVAIYPGVVGSALQKLGSIVPLLSIALVAFNLTVVVQEYARGLAARRRVNADEGLVTGLARMVSKSRRRYGGYVVHAGIAIMFLGFTGQSWGIDKETSMKPNDTFQIGDYTLTDIGSRMELDTTKRMVFADLSVTKNGKPLGMVSPAKFIYRKMPESPTTEIATLHTLASDLYVVVGTINPETKVATFQLHVNPLVSWVWGGVLVLILGALVSLWPELAVGEARVWGYARALGSTSLMVIFAFGLAMTPARAHAQTSSSEMAGTVEMHTQTEREVFPMLLCQCGGCARLPLSNCICPTAEKERARVRDELAAGVTKEQIFTNYVSRFGSGALAVPPNRGKLALIWLAPVGLFVAGGIAAGLLVRRWKRAGQAAPATGADPKESTSVDDYDSRLDDELKRLDD